MADLQPRKYESLGCEFCIDAGMDFDWCRMCGRGTQTPAPDPMGDILAQQAIDSIKAYNRGARGEGNHDITDLGGGLYMVTRKADR